MLWQNVWTFFIWFKFQFKFDNKLLHFIINNLGQLQPNDATRYTIDVNLNLIIIVLNLISNCSLNLFTSNICLFFNLKSEISFLEFSKRCQI